VTTLRTPPEPDAIDAVRSDGGLVRLRPVREDDRAALTKLFGQASQRSLYLRFFSLSRELAVDYVDRLLAPDDTTRRAVVASVVGEIVGVAEYERRGQAGESAEFAFLVGDERHGQGIGTLLVEYLAELARREGIVRFEADVLAENATALKLLSESGLRLHTELDAGTVHARIELEPAEAAVRAVTDREQIADTLSLRFLLAPRSVAVVGASNRRGAVGHEVLRNILDGGFTGQVFAVNPNQQYVQGVQCVPSADKLPIAPDLAIIAVPAEHVPDVVRACGERGVRGLLLLTAGFSETGADGRDKQAEITALAHRYGMRLIGPNCLGVLNTDPAVRLNATFAGMSMRPGALGLVSQSGALGIAVVGAAARCGLGISQFVSIGNKADVSGNDLLLAWEREERVRVIALYLESFGNPRKFARVARRVAQHKPIVAIKAGRSAAGRRAGQSHTAAAAASDDVVDALFQQAGVVRVTAMEQMLDATRVLSEQPLPSGPRVAIIGNSGGPGILSADAAEGAGLDVVTLSSETEAAVRSAVPTAASCQNPIDLGAAVRPDQLASALAAVLAAPEVDAALTVYTDTAVTSTSEVMDHIGAVAGAQDKPVVATRVGAPAGSIVSGDRALPVFTFPEPAAAALAVAVRYSDIRRARPVPVERPAGVDLAAARRLIAAAVHDGTEWLPHESLAELLTGYGIPMSPQRVVRGVDAAVAAAGELGYPLAVKLAAPGIHKSDSGGVRLDIADERQLRQVAAELGGVAEDALLLQPMAAAGTEVIVGAVQHDQFGPVVMLGAGGVLADLLNDRTFRLAPIAAGEAEAMIGELKLAKLLDGYRGRPAVPRAALADVVARVAMLVDDLPEVAELDLNPLVCTADGLCAVDARIRLAPAGQRPDPLVRQL
jgi:acetyl coenzyme A synthetase (ADP forming)-like protein